MDQLEWCIDYLEKYNGLSHFKEADKEQYFRTLMNITMPRNLPDTFYKVQDECLQKILARKTVTDVASFPRGVSLYRGDITLINADAIVNACNSEMLGCFIPGHFCIDNAIHSFAGLQLRRDMMEIMEKQGHDEVNGEVKVTKAYNLPTKYVFHTIGPIYKGTKQDEIDLRNCYLSCLSKADEMKLKSIVFCSISTGVFGYPIEKASSIAIKTTLGFLAKENKNIEKVIFDTFSENDYETYQRKIAEINR